MKTVRVTVRVTHDDINRGLRGSCQLCPIANAINRVLDRKLTIWSQVMGDRAVIVKNGRKAYGTNLPNHAQLFIDSFDYPVPGRLEKCPITPFDFQLDIPEEYLNDSAKAELGGTYAI